MELMVVNGHFLFRRTGKICGFQRRFWEECGAGRRVRVAKRNGGSGGRERSAKHGADCGAVSGGCVICGAVERRKVAQRGGVGPSAAESVLWLQEE